MKKYLPYIILILLLFLLNEASTAQTTTTLQVVTKVVEKTLPFKPNQTLKIKGVKSKIEITGWDKEEVKIKVSLISKNIDKKTAENDLTHIKQSISKTSSGLLLTNDYDAGKIGSGLSVMYEIMIPSKCQLDIKNSYGNVLVKEINGKLALDVEYGNIDLYNISGVINIKSYFNDITAENLSTSLSSIISNHSDIKLSNIKGNYTIENTYGDLSILSINEVKKLSIKSSKSDVNVFTNGMNKYNYNLSTNYGEIKLPLDTKYHLTENTETQKKLISSAPNISNIITISNSFGDVTIR